MSETVNYDTRILVGGASPTENPYTLETGKTYTAMPASEDVYGGALYVDTDGAVSGTDVTFAGNTAGSAGAVYVTGKTMTLDGNAAFQNNVATTAGALMVGTGGTASFLGEALFSGNIASSMYGGAIINLDTLVFEKRVTFSGNTASGVDLGAGGALYNTSMVCFRKGADFSGNTAAKSGGAIVNSGVVEFGGLMNLVTGSDTWINSQNSTVAWDLTDGREQYGSITNFDRVTNVDNSVKQWLWVQAQADGVPQQQTGAYIIATGVLATLGNKDNFTLKAGTKEGQEINSSGDFVSFEGNRYQLVTVGARWLVLAVAIKEEITTALSVTSDMGPSASSPYDITSTADIFSGIFSDAADSCGGALTVKSNAFAAGENLMFINNWLAGANTYGGAIMNFGTLTLSGTQDFYGNYATDGGAIYSQNNDGCTIEFSADSDVSFVGNGAANRAGAIYNSSVSSIHFGGDVLFEGNYALGGVGTGGGGAIHNASRMDFDGDAIFTGNYTGSDTSAGAISNNGTMQFNDGSKAVFSGNIASSGGAIVNLGLLAFQDTACFENNIATLEKGDGGAVCNRSQLRFDDGAFFSGNTAGGFGGAIFNASKVYFGGTINLATESDTWYNAGYSSVFWNIAAGLETGATINNYQYYSNEADSSIYQTITVQTSGQEVGDYVLAVGDMDGYAADTTGKYAFSITDTDGEEYSEKLSTGQSVTYKDRMYALAVNEGGESKADELVLTVTSLYEPPVRADFNVTDVSDVVIVNGKKLSVLHDQGSKFVQSKTLCNMGSWTLVEPEGDYNGDRRADALITSKTDGIRTLAGLFNIGVKNEIKFKAHNIFRYKTAEWSYRGKGDINGDGTTDIVIVLKGEKAVEMGLKGRVVQAKMLNENGKVEETVKMGVLKSKECVLTVADLLGNNKSTVIIWNVKTDMISYWEKPGSELYDLDYATGLNFVGSGDLNGNGCDDLLWQKADGSFTAWMDMANEEAETVDLGTQTAGWNFKQIGDYNGDGSEEVLWSADDGRLAFSSASDIKKLTVIA